MSAAMLVLAVLLCGSGVRADGPATAAAPGASATMHVSESVELEVSPSKAWKLIRDFDGLQTWHPGIASSQVVTGKGNAEGAVRAVTTGQGAKSTEKLLVYDDAGMRYRYKILESPLPVTDYISILEVSHGKNRGSVVTWYSTFRAKDGADGTDARKVISDLYTAGLGHLKEIAAK